MTSKSRSTLGCFVPTVIGGLIICLGGCATVRHVAAPREMPGPGIDRVKHELRVNMYQVDPRTQEEKLIETLVFDGTIYIQREKPVVNQEGKGQIPFTVMSWTATAFSRELKAPITYISSEGVEPPKSFITSERPGSKGPYTFVFRVPFDAKVGNKTVFRNHDGGPEGHGFLTIPPDGNRRNSPTITTFEKATIEADHPVLGKLRFRPLDCNDREGRTLIALQ